jgi:hypothetical protein
MAMGLVICMAFTESVLFHSVRTMPEKQACVYNMALKRNSAARTDAPTMPSGRAGGCINHGAKRNSTECPYSGDKRRVTYFYRQVNDTPPADPVSPLDITDELSKSNLLQRDCMRLGRAGGELLAESLGDVSVQTMPLRYS